MRRNNNNAGVHFVNHSNKNIYEEIAYYEKNSIEGITNKYNEAVFNLNSEGKFLFLKYGLSIRVMDVNQKSEYPFFYEVYIFEDQYEEKIRNVSKKCKLFVQADDSTQSIIVWVNKSRSIIYISTRQYEEKKGVLIKHAIYMLDNVWWR